MTDTGLHNFASLFISLAAVTDLQDVVSFIDVSTVTHVNALFTLNVSLNVKFKHCDANTNANNGSRIRDVVK